MGKQPFISHTVNGYSRYDVPESKAFTCTPGPLYPVRIEYINARDRVTISQGIDFRSNPLAVPSFNPYTVRLHRFWVPLQLYHPEMRTNSSKFDMNNLSLNWIPASTQDTTIWRTRTGFSNSLLNWLRIANRTIHLGANYPFQTNTDLNSASKALQWANADPYLAYWDIVRNYYSFSQWSVFSYAWPASWYISYPHDSSAGAGVPSYSVTDPDSPAASYFTQRYGNLEFLDAFYESQFYPSAVASTSNTFNRFNLYTQILESDLSNAEENSAHKKLGAYGDGYPVSPNNSGSIVMGKDPSDQFALSTTDSKRILGLSFLKAHPLAIVPSSPDRFSRLLPNNLEDNAVSMSTVTTIPQLAVASRLQEYKDLLGAGGSRFSDWLETFFASKIEHVDRPKLLFSASQVVNAQIVMNQAGRANLADQQPLGAMGGSIAFNTQLGRSQTYYFQEPGYLIDMFSIRPVYYWDGVRPDYLSFRGPDYFNPIYNDIGYQNVAGWQLYTSAVSGVYEATGAKEPCYNEFRSSYDEVLGNFSSNSGLSTSDSVPLGSYWVQQRTPSSQWGFGDNPYSTALLTLLFVDMATVNSPFASNAEDNFFINLSYSVRKKSLVNKTFATRLSSR